MTNIIQNQYNPDYVSPPGETLAEILEEHGMTQAELAERMGRPKKTINEIIKGKAEITPQTALELERVLGTPARFWNQREFYYREFLAKKKEADLLKTQIGFLRNFPMKKMTNWHWINCHHNKVDQLRELLNFFSVTSIDQIERLPNTLAVDFRKPTAFESNNYDLIAWLRKGEIDASQIKCNEYDQAKFKEVLKEIRLLTVKHIQQFKPLIVELCASAGVAVVLVPELPKTRVCGATRWLNPRKALLQLSDRYKKNDHFWFSFYHEAGHIILHGKRDCFIDLENNENNEKEKEANEFAANFLIPLKDWQTFKLSNSVSSLAVSEFAQRIGVAPGIIVGRLQREGVIDWSKLNNLKEPINFDS